MDEYQIKIRESIDSGSKDATMSHIKELLRQSSDDQTPLNEIHSKEFSRSGEDNDFISQGKGFSLK